MSYSDFFDPGKLEEIKNKDKLDKKNLLLKIIDLSPGIRYKELVLHVNKAPSTTSWNIKRLMDSDVIIRKRGDGCLEYSLKNSKKVEELYRKANTSLLDRSIDNYTSLIEDL